MAEQAFEVAAGSAGSYLAGCD